MQYRHRRLHRSVTETRKLPSGLWSLSVIIGLNPFFTAVAPLLFLPDRQALLHLFDHVAAGREGFIRMRIRRGDSDAGLDHGNHTETVLEHHARPGPTLVRLRQDARDLLERHGLVGGIVDGGDIAVVAHGSQEYARPSPLRALDLGQEVGDVEGVAREMHHQPPASGGSSATSSPSVTGASSFTWRWFNAASGVAGIAWVPGKTSRTRAITSATVVGVGTLTCDHVQPASSAYRAKIRTEIFPMVRL